MDLIDKQLSEKLKLFDYIDKKYGTNIDQPNFKKKNIEDYNIIENRMISNNELYDNIYSDFKTNSYKSFFNSPSSNNLDLNITKNYKKIIPKKNNKIYDKNYKNHNLSRDREFKEFLSKLLKRKLIGVNLV